MRKGEYIGVNVLLNTHTKFAKLAVGKHVVSAKQRHNNKDPLFPLAVALSGLPPLTKVWVNYEPQPKNTFEIKVNDAEIYSLVKEEVDYDPTKTEELFVELKVNMKVAISRHMPWIINDVADKIETELGMDHLSCLEIRDLESESWVANEFLDLLCSYDLPENGLDKLILNCFYKKCEPFEEEVVSRLANMCSRLSHLELSKMWRLSEAGRISMVSLFRQIIQNNPPIKELNMEYFSRDKDRDENIGELVLETLLTSNIDSITKLNLDKNRSWFCHPDTEEEILGNADLLAELISKQVGLEDISIAENVFSSNAT